MTMTIVTVLSVGLILAILIFGFLERQARVHARSSARRLLDDFRGHFVPDHELRLLGPETLPEEGREPLEEAGRALQRAGGQFIGDMEDVTVTGILGCCIPIRSYLFESLGFQASAYYYPWVGRLIYELSSELSDGRGLTTGSAQAAGKLDTPPSIDRLQLSYETPLEELIRIHTERLAAFRQDNPNLELILCATPEELMARQQKLERAKYEHRSKNGWISEEEVIRLAPPGREEWAKLVHAEIRKLVKADERGDSGTSR